jgi:hypothetical protein
VASDSLGGRSLRGRGVVVSQPHLFVLLVDCSDLEAGSILGLVDSALKYQKLKSESAYLQLGPDWTLENITEAYAKQLVEQCLKYWRQRQPLIEPWKD